MPVGLASAGICLSIGVPAMLPYLTNQSCSSGFHVPSAALIAALKARSEALIRTGTRDSAANRTGGCFQSVFSIISSNVFSR